MTEEERQAVYQRGFLVAINFLYFHHETIQGEKRPEDDKPRFENFLKLHMTDRIVDEALRIVSNESSQPPFNCQPGFCPRDGQCVLCTFDWVFDARNFT